MKSNVESYQSMNMGPRNLLILFFSAVAVSLVILIILSSLVFKNLSLDFNTHLPETTPDIGRQFSSQTQSMNPDSKADNVSRATVNVPPESVEPAASTTTTEAKKADQGAPNTAPVSDDSALENSAPLPLGDTMGPDDETGAPETTLKPNTEKPTSLKNSSTTRPSSRTTLERKPEQMTPAYPADVPSNNTQDEQNSGPPVPGQ